MVPTLGRKAYEYCLLCTQMSSLLGCLDPRALLLKSAAHAFATYPQQGPASISLLLGSLMEEHKP